MKQTCNVCNWFEVDTEDPLCEVIKKRHESKHIKHQTFSERDGKKISQNNINGEVEWK